MYTYVCQIFVLFLPTFLFVQSTFRQTPNARAHEVRPDTLAEVSARSVHSGARGGRSKVFLSAGVDKTISLVSIREALFRTYVSVNCCLFSSHQVYYTQQQQKIPDPIVPTLPPTRRACVCDSYAQFCCDSLCLSEPAVRISSSAFPSYTFCCVFFHVQTQAGVPGNLYHHQLPPCCFFCRYVLLCVIQQCHCSRCAQHSAPTQ